MNIGILFGQWDNPSVSSILYPIVKGKVEVIEGGPGNNSFPHPTKFKIVDDGITYHFTKDLEDISYCDVKICCAGTRVTTDECLDKFKDKVDYFLLAGMDGESPTGTEFENMPKWLTERNDVIVVCSHRYDQIDGHPRAILDRALNLFYFFNAHGYYFLNYYPNNNKEYLIGVYNKFSEYKTFRSKLLDLFSDYADQEIHRFTIEHSFHTDVGGQIMDPWAWRSQHISSYTDYNQAVANIVFETQVGFHIEDMLTEKTLKSIIFQRANIFFIYCGTSGGLEWLHSKGFWFLNSEFYEPDNLENVPYFPDDTRASRTEAIPVYRSVYKSVNYLKNLKDELKTNNAVYEYLLEKYKDKLQQNKDILDTLLNTCEYKDKLLNIIKGTK